MIRIPLKALYALNGMFLSLWIGLYACNTHLAIKIQQREHVIRTHQDKQTLLEELKRNSFNSLTPNVTPHGLKKRIRETAKRKGLKLKSLVLTPQHIPSLLQVRLIVNAFLEDDAFTFLDHVRTLPGLLGFQYFKLEKHPENLPPFTFQITTIWTLSPKETS